MRKDEYNGNISTRINVLHTLPQMKNQPSTALRYVDESEALTDNMTAIYKIPPALAVIDNYTAARSDMVVPFRASVRGFVIDLGEDFAVSQNGNAMRSFSLMDRRGAHISCNAVDRHANSSILQNNIEVIVYFATGRPGIGSLPSCLYLYNDAVVVVCSDDEPPVSKRTAIELEVKSQ